MTIKELTERGFYHTARGLVLNDNGDEYRDDAGSICYVKISKYSKRFQCEHCGTRRIRQFPEDDRGALYCPDCNNNL